MTDQQAKQQAKKRWGKKFAVRNAGHFSSADKRSEASNRVSELRAKKESLIREKDERLKALDWLTEINRKIVELNKEIQNEIPKTMFKRFDVGRVGGVAGMNFFEVLGSGDTWEEAFAQADKRALQ